MNEVTICDQTVQLLPEKLVHLPGSQTLLLADAHFGKAATFRRSGIPVPEGTTSAMLGTLAEITRQCDVRRIIALGDLFHSATSSKRDFETELVAWRTRHRDLEVILVKGNHDRGHQKLLSQMTIEVVPAPWIEPPFAFCHFQSSNNNRALFTFAGHVHPAVTVHEPGLGKTRLPCFAWASDHMLLPAFGQFTGTHVIDTDEYEQIIAVAGSSTVVVKSIRTTIHDS